MSPLLRGEGETQFPDEEKPKNLKDFVSSLAPLELNDIPKEDRYTFREALNQQNKDKKLAKQKYEDLLKKYKDNPVIKYNMSLLNKK